MAAPLAYSYLLECLSREAGEFGRLAAVADWDAPVPGCPGWTVQDLVGHLGTIHRWATTIVSTGQVVDEPMAPVGSPAELLAWFDEGAATLVATLRGIDPDRECWTFGPRPHRAGFWIRRQAHETTVHGWDMLSAVSAAESATSGSAGVLADHLMDTELAADGIDEIVRIFFPRQVRLGRIPPLPDTVELVDEATGRRWLLGGDGATNSDAVTPAATVTGLAVRLLLVLWRRAEFADLVADARLSLAGDQAAALRTFRAALTP